MLTETQRRERMTVPQGKIRLVIDSDAKNEVDDQFAIAWALRSPERFDLEAVYAVPFSHTYYHRNLGNPDPEVYEDPREGMEQSYQEILKLFSLLGEDSRGRVFRGAEHYIEDAPVDSEAVEDLIARGMASEEPLYVVAIGAATNVASALMREPRLADHIVVIWLGGQPPHFPNGIEFNLTQDIKAARCLFESRVPMIWVPCMGVASLLSLSDADVREKLLGKSPICTYLAQIVLDQFTDLNKAVTRADNQRRYGLRGRDDHPEAYLKGFTSRHVSWSRTIWDISTIAFLKNPNWTASTLIPAPVLLDNCAYAHGEGERHYIRVVNYCQRDLIFGDMLACLTGQEEERI